MTNGAGNVHSRQLFLPYGDTRWQEGALPTDFGFGGQRRDGSTGLVFMHARYYHAGVGRFTQADTIVPEPRNPQDFNRYAYVRNNPLNYIDPSGHAICVDEGCTQVVHPVTGEIIQRGPAISLPPLSPEEPPPLPTSMSVAERPGIPVSEWRREAAYWLNVGGAILDTGAFGLSVPGVFIEYSTWFAVSMLDTPVPGPADVAAPFVAMATYQGTVGRVEDWLGRGSLLCTGAADLLGGYTYPDFDTESGLPELVVGQDTAVSLATNMVGLMPEATVDAGANLVSMYYSWASLTSLAYTPST